MAYNDDKINMVHGAGGEVMQQMISEIVLSNVTKKSVNGGIGLESLDDSATIPIDDENVVVTTIDSHTIQPLFFPGGDIGRISAAGTLNDISVMGVKPVSLSNSMVISEGFSREDLDKIMKSMDEACQEVGAAIVTGDTKVIDSDKLDSMIITTAGIGIGKKENVVRDCTLNVGDKVIVTGTVGDHGMAIMSKREGFGYDTELQSDVAPVWSMVEAAQKVGKITAMKDPTRGGIANALNEMANKSGVGMRLYEENIPVRPEVEAVSDMLGIDPFEVANEGKIVMGVEAENAEDMLEAIRKTKYGKNAQIIGEVTDTNRVIMETLIGGERLIEPPIADPVPRVC
ncbi:MAG: hydrogenase expression/formation protein HypE [Methanosphaera sp.]|uniref:hydrogenase expression/formation protein HypE n=1 Tax=Methanosphaera sp. TaxID=2666342 RepID=UPI0025D97DD7|nr:hydrogenase expression/formation protein HypE [Methanosphaera sp.]MCI5867398.1 hydrogenase expression/formation protein HypE [Methanosphaera sp.]MDD6534534.1 hydrogenase expression/formation protein HypE [Methanosphaera sp.]MDY3955797.1 hydrogenase expression/formation protein HypE [Methanosphaera sp.]